MATIGATALASSTPEPSAESTLEPTEEPPVIVTDPPRLCPSSPPTEPLSVRDFLALDPTCLGTATLTVVGWAAAPPAFGVLPPVIEPGWLAYWNAGAFAALWEGMPDDSSECGGRACAWMFVHIAPGSTLTFTTIGRWMRVTGHVNDPIAETCHWVLPPDMSPEDALEYQDASAQAQCREQLVVESLQVTTAP
ncbi:MAG: hypothetical protein HY263_06480 [Chloroflexi bacterium]|nr:hypothetical protein [Chloroflexota bacterium]